MENNHQKEEKTIPNTPNSLIEQHEEEKKRIESKFTTEEEFVEEVEKIFTSLKDRNPFSLGIYMGYDELSFMEGDIYWRIFPPDGGRWSLSKVESALRVLASRQTPNVREAKLYLYDNELGDISAEVWKLCSKLNNLTCLNIGDNKLKVVSSLVCDLTHLQHLNLYRNKISAEGVVVVCELLKVCSLIVFDTLLG